MALPTISRDCNNNLTTVRVGTLTVSFSYTTPVAFWHPKTGQVTSENVWSNTTGRHLNAIDGGSPEAKRKRVPHSTFATCLELIGDGTTRSATRAVRILDTARRVNQ